MPTIYFTLVENCSSGSYSYSLFIQLTFGIISLQLNTRWYRSPKVLPFLARDPG